MQRLLKVDRFILSFIVIDNQMMTMKLQSTIDMPLKDWNTSVDFTCCWWNTLFVDKHREHLIVILK